jgi:outer membrane protein assembly factor BamB
MCIGWLLLWGCTTQSFGLLRTVAADGGANDWPQLLGPTGDGKSAAKGIRTQWETGLPLQWFVALGASYGIGSVAEGQLFQFDRYGDQERLSCYDLTHGSVIWSIDQPVQYTDMYGYNDGPRSSPAIDQGRVFTYGVAGRLTCHDQATGKVVWTKGLNEEFGVIQNFFGVGSSPLVFQSLVIVIVGGSPQSSQNVSPGQLDRVEPAESAVVAFDVASGEERWRAGNDLASYSSPRLAWIDGNPIVLAFCRDALWAIDPKDGSPLWHFPFRAALLESVNGACPIIRGNEVLISECYEMGSTLLRISRSEAKIVWQDPPGRRGQQAMRAHWSTPIEIDGFVYGCSGRNAGDADLRCIRWDDGALQWSDRRRVRSSLLAVDSHLIVLDESGKLELHRVNPKQMDRIAEMDLTDLTPQGSQASFQPPCWAAPIVANGQLLVRGNGEMASFQLLRDRR